MSDEEPSTDLSHAKAQRREAAKITDFVTEEQARRTKSSTVSRPFSLITAHYPVVTNHSMSLI